MLSYGKAWLEKRFRWSKAVQNEGRPSSWLPEAGKAYFERPTGANLLGVWLDHDVTIDENGTNDGKREEWMGEDMYGDPSYGMERREET